MPHSFLRGRWLHTLSAGAAICLSIASINSLKAADRNDSADSAAQVSGRAVTKDVDVEDRGQYPGLSFVKTGTSTSTVRKQAIADLGLDRLTPEARAKAQSLLKNLGMYRRLPTISFECDPDLYEYFVKNPDVAVATWRAMDISQFQLQETSPNRYRADAGDGSIGEVELFLQTPTETLIHCDGAFKSPLLPKPIVARSLMRLQTTFVTEADGRVIGTHTGDVFVEFPSHAIEAAAKVISPVSHSIADRNFKQMTLFVHLMSQAVVRHPAWVEAIGDKLDGIPKQKKQDFLEVAAKTCADTRKRIASASSAQTFSPDEVLTPFRQWNAQGSGLGSTQQTTRGGKPVQSTSQPGTATLRN